LTEGIRQDWYPLLQHVVHLRHQFRDVTVVVDDVDEVAIRLQSQVAAEVDLRRDLASDDFSVVVSTK